MPTFAAEQLSNCVLIIDELRRVLQCPPEVGLVAHARSTMEKLPNESVARQLLIDIQSAEPLLYEQLCHSTASVPFSRLFYIASGMITVPYLPRWGTEEQAKESVALLEVPHQEPEVQTILGSEDSPASSP